MNTDEKAFVKKVVASGKSLRTLLHPGDSKYNSSLHVFDAFRYYVPPKGDMQGSYRDILKHSLLNREGRAVKEKKTSILTKFIKNRNFDLGWAQLRRERIEKENEYRMYERIELISSGGLWVVILLIIALILINLFRV